MGQREGQRVGGRRARTVGGTDFPDVSSQTLPPCSVDVGEYNHIQRGETCKLTKTDPHVDSSCLGNT